MQVASPSLPEGRLLTGQATLNKAAVRLIKTATPTPALTSQTGPDLTTLTFLIASTGDPGACGTGTAIGPFTLTLTQTADDFVISPLSVPLADEVLGRLSARNVLVCVRVEANYSGRIEIDQLDLAIVVSDEEPPAPPAACPPTTQRVRCDLLEFSAMTLASGTDSGSRSQGVGLADFDGDCQLDLAVANYGTFGTGTLGSSLVVVRANGTLAFDAPLVLEEGMGESRVAVADLDGDGEPDVVVNNPNSAQIAIHRNLGGRFAARSTRPVDFGTAPSGVAIDDLNGDGVRDIVAVSNEGGSMTVFLNQPGGGLLSSSTLAVGFEPTAVEIVDVDGDGAVDLLVGNSMFGSFSIGIHFGVGDGTFGARTDMPTGQTPFDVASADFDGDGLLDVATANANGDSVTILFGDGTGAFPTTMDLSVPEGPLGVLAADLDGDTIPDIAVASGVARSLTILQSNGDRTFTESTIAMPIGAYDAAADDLDNDGDVDLIVASNGDVITLLRNLCVE